MADLALMPRMTDSIRRTIPRPRSSGNSSPPNASSGRRRLLEGRQRRRRTDRGDARHRAAHQVPREERPDDAAREEGAAAGRRCPAVSELVAARLLVAYHLEQQRPMMASFLDALGIKHEDGLIADEELAPPRPRRLARPRQDAGRLVSGRGRGAVPVDAGVAGSGDVGGALPSCPRAAAHRSGRPPRRTPRG